MPTEMKISKIKAAKTSETDCKKDSAIRLMAIESIKVRTTIFIYPTVSPFFNRDVTSRIGFFVQRITLK